MQPEMLPLFPLRVVLFPRTQIPLHIFEDRYKEMIGEACRKSEFGIVLAAEKGIVGTGCTAVVEEVTQTYPDGRMDVVVGVRRFEIVDLDTEKSYLRGSVDFFNDDETDEAGAELQERALKGYNELKEFFGSEGYPILKWKTLSELPTRAVSRGRGVSPAAAVLRSERERMRQLVDFLPGHVEQQRHAWHVRTVAPWSGCRSDAGTRLLTMRQYLIIDADDTLWENNIYFERAFAEFVDFLAHSTLTRRRFAQFSTKSNWRTSRFTVTAPAISGATWRTVTSAWSSAILPRRTWTK